MRKYVLEVNLNDESVKLVEKIAAHKDKLLHRAFSVFIHDGNGNILIQRRANNKYHSGGLLTNACCSHPISGNVKTEAIERMKEELGFYCDISFVDKFVYLAEFENGLFEYELDYVFVGKCESSVKICFDPAEISEVNWVNINDLLKSVKDNPEQYTKWFITALFIAKKYM